MIKINYEKCTGCYACSNICPKQCIELKTDDEGFRYPSVDTSKCIDCHLCEKICPIDKKTFNDLAEYKPHAFACYSTDEEIRANSVTAGICYLVGKRIIENGGVVFGVVGNVVDRVYHTMATTIDELLPMRDSKYLQSEIGDTFKQAKTQLNQGKKVLFTGTPCQIAGLNSYLGREYDNLLTIDLICHGVPSKMVFDKFISEVEENTNCKVTYMGRDKSVGWKPCSFKYTLSDGTSITQKGSENIFNRGFATNIFQRKSCTHCAYTKIPRVGDITVGDYFQGDKAKLHDSDNKGLSLITCNSQKGLSFINSLEDQITKWEYPIEIVVTESEHLAKSPKQNIYRRTFFWMLKKKSYSKTAKIMLPKTKIGKNLRRVYGVFCYVYEWIRKAIF